jgi:hypothetical protein
MPMISADTPIMNVYDVCIHESVFSLFQNDIFLNSFHIESGLIHFSVNRYLAKIQKVMY